MLANNRSLGNIFSRNKTDNLQNMQFIYTESSNQNRPSWACRLGHSGYRRRHCRDGRYAGRQYEPRYGQGRRVSPLQRRVMSHLSTIA